MKRKAAFFMAAVCLASLSACHGLPPTAAEFRRRDDEAAAQVLQDYRQPFIDKVNEAYGDSASLSNT